jgi:hypothetical protein
MQGRSTFSQTDRVLDGRKHLLVSPESYGTRKFHFPIWNEFCVIFQDARAFFAVASQRVNREFCATANAPEHFSRFSFKILFNKLGLFYYCLPRFPFLRLGRKGKI